MTDPPVTTAVPDGVARLSDDGPWRLVDSAPGVTSPGLVYELMPKLWAFLPTEESEDDGALFVPAPTDIPIIEAYLQAVLVYNRAAQASPMRLDDPGWEQFFTADDGGYAAVLKDRDDRGERLDLDSGVVRRPRVLGESRTTTTAIVFDCVLDGSVFRLPTGDLAPGSTLGVAPVGVSAELVLQGERWLVRGFNAQPEACA